MHKTWGLSLSSIPSGEGWILPPLLQPHWNTMPSPLRTDCRRNEGLSSGYLHTTGHTELASKPIGQIWFNCANVPLPKDKIFKANIDQPLENPRWEDGESISTGSIKKISPRTRLLGNQRSTSLTGSSCCFEEFIRSLACISHSNLSTPVTWQIA